MPMYKNIEEEIEFLKKEKNAVVLAHFYEDGEIQEVADHVGDSLYLAQVGKESRADIILLAGVVFMAESVKILSPTKKVLVPDLAAGCSLVKGSPADLYAKWKNEHPDHILVSYINCSAEVKAISDIICTSSNAEKIIHAIPQEKSILFGPDKNLGRFLQKQTHREMVLWPGSCEVHMQFNAQQLFTLINDHPDAVVIAHPECEEEVLHYASVIGSTSRLLQEVKENPSKKFIVATEDGIFHEMKKQRPDVELIQAPAGENCACNQCPYMKLNNLEKLRNALRDESPEVKLPSDLIEKARGSLDKMLAISNGENIQF